MKKLLTLLFLVIGLTASAQTFSFECETNEYFPVATIRNFEGDTNVGPGESATLSFYAFDLDGNDLTVTFYVNGIQNNGGYWEPNYEADRGCTQGCRGIGYITVTPINNERLVIHAIISDGLHEVRVEKIFNG